MAKGYDQEFLSELKAKNDIVDVISKYIPLEQKGRNYWARCPFHHEKTPSFCINREEQFYHCFGCGKSGDVITFIMEFESVDYPEAIRILADRAGIPLKTFDYDSEKIKEAKEKKERILAVLTDTARFYYRNLSTEAGAKYLEYIYSRGFGKDIIKKFGLGASLNYEDLPRALFKKKHKEEDVLEAGVCGRKNGRFYDFEAGRLIVPIINAYGQVIAFGGRVLEKKPDFAKYKNTAETSVFIKNKTLFNINNLKKLKNEKGFSEVIMVEGYMDTIALVANGFENVVASMGTSLTKEQARLLKRYTDKVVICYDGDSAGQKATIRGLEILSDEGLSVRVVDLPDGLDPDEIIKMRGREAYRKCLDDAKPLIDFKLDALKRSYDITKTEERRKYLKEAVDVIRTSSNKIEQEELLKTLSEESGITFESLRKQLDSEEVAPKKEEKEIVVHEKEAGEKNLQAQRFILEAMLFNKPYTRDFDINEIEFDRPSHLSIAKYIDGERKAKKLCKVNVLYDILDGKEAHDELDAILGLGLEEREEKVEERYFKDCVSTLKRCKMEKEIASLTELLSHEDETAKRSDIKRMLMDKIAELGRI